MNYSWRIAAEPGFWPWAAMSPYTAPWAHYWAALFLKVLGPSLWVFRFSQVSLALSGLGFLCFALPRAVRGAFPWAVLLLPGVVLNHRFAIELTGLHVLAFGVLCFALSKRWWVLACVAALVGTTAHILFYGVVLGLLFAVVTRHGAELSRRERTAFLAYFTVMSLFFLQVLFAIPEKGKAGALVLSAVGAAALVLMKGERWYLWRSVWWARVLPVLAAVFVFNALFFGQGAWSLGTYNGRDVWYLYVQICLVGFAFLSIASIWSLSRSTQTALFWFLSSTFCFGLMMLKPAPRYFEIVLLGLTYFLSHSITLAAKSWAEKADSASGKLLLSIKIGLISAAVITPLGLNPYLAFGGFFSKHATHAYDRPLRFLFFKDSSRDFLDKQSLVKFLGRSGCKFSDIETHDPRLKETLTALSLGDWKVDEKSPCPYVYVARKTEDGASGEANGEFVLKRRN